MQRSICSLLCYALLASNETVKQVVGLRKGDGSNPNLLVLCIELRQPAPSFGFEKDIEH